VRPPFLNVSEDLRVAVRRMAPRGAREGGGDRLAAEDVSGGGVLLRHVQVFPGRLLLRPGQEVNEVVGGVFARAVQQSGGAVRLYGFTLAATNFLLLVRVQGAGLASFM